MDGNLQDAPDMEDPGIIEIRLGIMNVVQKGFRGSGEERRKALEVVGAMTTSHCSLIRQIVAEYTRRELAYINSKGDLFPEVL